MTTLQWSPSRTSPAGDISALSPTAAVGGLVGGRGAATIGAVRSGTSSEFQSAGSPLSFSMATAAMMSGTQPPPQGHGVGAAEDPLASLAAKSLEDFHLTDADFEEALRSPMPAAPQQTDTLRGFHNAFSSLPPRLGNDMATQEMGGQQQQTMTADPRTTHVPTGPGSGRRVDFQPQPASPAATIGPATPWNQESGLGDLYSRSAMDVQQPSQKGTIAHQNRRRQDEHHEHLGHIEHHAGEASSAILKIYEAQRELQGAMQTLLAKTEHKIMDIEGAISEFEGIERNLAQRQQEVKELIDVHCSNLARALELRKNELLDEVDRVVDMKFHKLDEQKRTLQESVAILHDGYTFARQAEVTEINTKPEILQHLQEARSMPCDLHPPENDVLVFDPRNVNLEEEIRTFGAVGGMLTTARECTAHGEGLSFAQVGQKSRFIIHAIDSHGNFQDAGGDHIHVELLRDDGDEGEENASGSANIKQQSHRLLGDLASSVDVSDNRDGTYECSYIPRADGQARLHVRVDGLPISGSPFLVQIRGQCVSFRFTPLESPNAAIIDAEGRIARHNMRSNAHRVALAEPVLPTDQRSWFKFRVSALRGNGWMFLGIVGADSPRDASHRESSAFGWANHKQVWEGGLERRGKDAWEGFRIHDAPVMMYDPDAGTLTMLYQSPKRVYTIVTGPPPVSGFRIHANLLGTGDRVELMVPTGDERRLVAAEADNRHRDGAAGNTDHITFNGSGNIRVLSPGQRRSMKAAAQAASGEHWNTSVAGSRSPRLRSRGGPPHNPDWNRGNSISSTTTTLADDRGSEAAQFRHMSGGGPSYN